MDCIPPLPPPVSPHSFLYSTNGIGIGRYNAILLYEGKKKKGNMT